MSQTYHLDGMVVRDQDNQYVCEIIAYDTDGLNSLLRAPEVLALVQTDRDIKAANLQLLVGAVAAYETACHAVDGLTPSGDIAESVEANLAWESAETALFELARSLKQ